MFAVLKVWYPKSTMKLYGVRKHDKARCEWGCCGGRLIFFKKDVAARRAAKKRARREARVEVTSA